MDIHAMSIAQTVAQYKTHETKGLKTAEAQKRQALGKNILPQTQAKANRMRIFLHQWKSPLIIILLVAATISGILGETVDMVIIYVTALVNAIIGFFQEYKANAALERLQHFVSFYSFCLRDGKKQRVSSDELVCGDIVFLEAGDYVPADGRLLIANELSINEAALTGESQPVLKKTAICDAALPLAERINMVFKGTAVINGSGQFIVTQIGIDTQLGNIAMLVKETKDELTPLQKQLELVAKKLSIIIIILALSIFIIGLLFGKDQYTAFELFETAIAVAVAAIPEGLVISLTVILAIGMQFILKRHALVRRLVAAETLGSVSVICTDKTGTLTEGNMSVVQMYTAEGMIEGIALKQLSDMSDARLALDIGALCNNAIEHTKEGKTVYLGDTTETALLAAAHRAGINKQALEKDMPRLQELPFSSERKYMATLHRFGKGKRLLVKGAPEIMLDASALYIDSGKQKKLSAKQRTFFLSQAAGAAAAGYRTLALCYKESESNKVQQSDIDALVFVGLVAIADPVRSDVKEMLGLAQQAGIRVIMMTGDHADTAKAIAKQLGLFDAESNQQVCEGKELDTLTTAQLKKTLSQVTVFARVAPEHKIRLVQLLQQQGEVVAMTGDGVNDAPAIKAADIGIAVGSGTDVAKETADMVLLNDSFSTIVAAIQEGRNIYQNIKKIVLYLLSSSFAEVVMITGSILAGLPVAALPAQILWVNVLQDSFPTMALAFDRSDKDAMSDPPRKKDEPLIDKDMKIMILLKSILSNIALFCIFVYILKSTEDVALARTMVFVGFAVDALFYIFSIRSLRHSVWQINPFGNRYLLAAIAFGWIMLVAAIYVAPLQFFLHTVPLSLTHWGMMIAFGIFNLCIMEAMKRLFFIKK